MNLDIQNLRKEYSAEVLELDQVDPDPIRQFGAWFKEALDAQLTEPNAMILATVNAQGHPVARVVLLKGFDETGFVFYTNYNSQKGQELTHTPYAALVFNWLELQRQVRIEGSVVKVSPEESTAYFQSRPKGSQIGAWASPQSQIIADRTILEENVRDLENKYAEREKLPRPTHWGGYLVRPNRLEFWQGRPSRLHDRIRYTWSRESENWQRERLAP